MRPGLSESSEGVKDIQYTSYRLVLHRTDLTRPPGQPGPGTSGGEGQRSVHTEPALWASNTAARMILVSQLPADSEDYTFDVYLRRQFRIGNFKVSLEPVGMGYQPRAILDLDATELRLTRVTGRGEPMQGTSTSPRSWTWCWDQVIGAQAILVTLAGWGLSPPTRYGVRLDIQGEGFYPLVATHTLDDLVQALQSHGVEVDQKPRKLNWFLTGWK